MSSEISPGAPYLCFGDRTIAATYKERWQIELFFEAFKDLTAQEALCLITDYIDRQTA